MDSDESELSDAEPMRAAASDPAAFGELYERHALRVYTWCRRRLEWAASDLTAETFAQAWIYRRRFRYERGGSALPWLLGIAHNVLRESAGTDRGVRCRRLQDREGHVTRCAKPFPTWRGDRGSCGST